MYLNVKFPTDNLLEYAITEHVTMLCNSARTSSVACPLRVSTLIAGQIIDT